MSRPSIPPSTFVLFRFEIFRMRYARGNGKSAFSLFPSFFHQRKKKLKERRLTFQPPKHFRFETKGIRGYSKTEETFQRETAKCVRIRAAHRTTRARNATRPLDAVRPFRNNGIRESTNAGREFATFTAIAKRDEFVEIESRRRNLCARDEVARYSEFSVILRKTWNKYTPANSCVTEKGDNCGNRVIDV